MFKYNFGFIVIKEIMDFVGFKCFLLILKGVFFFFMFGKDELKCVIILCIVIVIKVM